MAESTRHDRETGPIPERLAADVDRDDLSRLVRERNDDGWSYQAMADLAEKAGHPLSKPYFQKMATGSVSAAPDERRLLALAAALGVPLRVVKRAAARQYLAYEDTELGGYDDSTQVIVAHLAGMDEAERLRWRRLIEADERARREARDREG